ncbi:MAG: hypothetical protein H6733_02020 [Alphaproteobacteria bacterium]|nr:hypothetical protein [Alphaproteobacteria bacterium]
MRRIVLVAVLATAGCPVGEDLPALLDTGWFDDDGPDGCTAKLTSTVPADGATGWYWRDDLQVLVDEAGTYAVRLLEADGKAVDHTVSTASTGVSLDVHAEGGLAPDTDYTLEVTDCTGVHAIGFTTSSYGAPLRDGPSTIQRRTYSLDLVNATWVEPGGFGAVLAGLFNAPVLLGVQYVDATWMDWIGTTGTIDLGVVGQDQDLPTWDFPLTTFEASPFFETSADSIELDVQGFPLPITDFQLEGTFAADGSTFGGARLSGLGDSRYAGGAVGQPDNPAGLCNLATGIGVPCVPCPDGEVYCLQVEIVDLTAHVVPGLVLVPIADTD